MVLRTHVSVPAAFLVVGGCGGATLILAHRQHPRTRLRTHPQPAGTHDHHAGTLLLRTQCHTRRSQSPRSSSPMPHAPLPLPSVLFAPQHAHSDPLSFMQDLTRRSHRPRWPRSTYIAFFLFRVPTLFLAGRYFFLLAAHCAVRHACSHTRTLARACTDDRRTNDATCGPPAWLTGS